MKHERGSAMRRMSKGRKPQEGCPGHQPAGASELQRSYWMASHWKSSKSGCPGDQTAERPCVRARRQLRYCQAKDGLALKSTCSSVMRMGVRIPASTLGVSQRGCNPSCVGSDTHSGLPRALAAHTFFKKGSGELAQRLST